MSTNLSLSFELICLMGWLLRQQKDELKHMFESAIEKGFLEELQASDVKEFLDNAAASNEVVHDFFAFLEKIIQQKLEEQSSDIGSEGFLAEELRKIDGQFVDQHLLFSSIQKVKKECLLSQQADESCKSDEKVKTLLCEHLLQQWDPSQHDQLN